MNDYLLYGIIILSAVILFMSGFFLGKLIYTDESIVYGEYRLLGVWFGNADGEYVWDYISSSSNPSKWICLNIEGRSEEEILNTCNHELAHEIFNNRCRGNKDCIDFIFHKASEVFAQKCEENISRCMDFVPNNYSAVAGKV